MLIYQILNYRQIRNRKIRNQQLLCTMFTGIIESLGKIIAVEKKGTNASFWVSSPLSAELKIDQSLSHDGVCLTVDELKDGMHRVTAIEETLKKRLD